MIQSSNFEHIFQDIVTDLLDSPQYESSPRGMRVRERLGVSFCLTNPRARLLASPARQANYRFATGEFLWYDRGARDLESIAYYNTRMKDFSDDGETLNSAYGHHLEGQWDAIIRELSRDPDSRRAVMTIYDPRFLRQKTKDVPCTLSLQFFIRAGRLNLHVVMRSNDVIWGLTNDLFSFTLMQEKLLLRLRVEANMPDLELGNYYHTAGSMHLYERHFEMASQIALETVNLDPAPPMPPLTSLCDLQSLQNMEAALRGAPGEQAGQLYEGAEAWMLDRLNEHRRIRDNEQRPPWAKRPL